MGVGANIKIGWRLDIKGVGGLMAGVSDPVLGLRPLRNGESWGRGGSFSSSLVLAPRGLCLHLCMSSPSKRPTLFNLILFFNLCLEAWLLCTWDWGCWVGHGPCSAF